jgi:phosphate:Na+ symporter
MDFFNVVTLAGGLAFFLFGMNLMSTSLETLVGGKLESILKKMTSNPFKGLVLGMVVTIAIQSSSAMTVMLVGLVNSGIMELSQTIGVIMGSNIGTTFTGWILSLTGLDSSNVFLRLLKPETWSPIIALIGAAMVMFSKHNRRKSIGNIMVGFAVLMTGMSLMSQSVSGLQDDPNFTSVLTMFNNPLVGILIGTAFTAIIQSSAASLGILQSLSMTGQITFNISLPLIMGFNIGTCITALLSSIGANKNAKRVTAVHISFNVIGTLFCMLLFYISDIIFHFDFVNKSVGPFEIAIIHTCFNLITTILLFPFTKQLEKLAKFIIKDNRSHNNEEVILDDRLLLSPSFAVAESRKVTDKMASITRKTILQAIDLIDNYDQKVVDQIEEDEHKIDEYEDKLGTYLVKVSAGSLSHADSGDVSQLLHTIGDLERIGDHAVNLLGVAREIHDKDLHFSTKASDELQVLTKAIKDILNLTIDAFLKKDNDAAKNVEPLEQVIDSISFELKDRHVIRLQNRECTIELGFVFSDIINNYERISDHCSNIAVCQIEIAQSNTMDTHDYLDKVKYSTTGPFKETYDSYKEKYVLPTV